MLHGRVDNEVCMLALHNDGASAESTTIQDRSIEIHQITNYNLKVKEKNKLFNMSFSFYLK